MPGLALVIGGSLGGMVALEVALERPDAVRSVVPIAAPAATGALAVAWNAIQRALVDRLGDDGLALARQLAMTTYRSEADFDQRFGRAAEADGTPSIVSYLRYQGQKLVRRFDPDTYRTLVGAMDRHDIGAGRGGVGPALARLADHGVRLTGLGISGDILYGPGPGPGARDGGCRGGRPRPVPGAALHEGPRRLPGRVGGSQRHLPGNARRGARSQTRPPAARLTGSGSPDLSARAPCPAACGARMRRAPGMTLAVNQPAG